MNILIIQKLLKSHIKKKGDNESLLGELSDMAKLPNFSQSSTVNVRNIITLRCFESGQWTKSFNDNADVGEFIQSLFQREQFWRFVSEHLAL